MCFVETRVNDGEEVNEGRGWLGKGCNETRWYGQSHTGSNKSNREVTEW